jgi:hypothetical protein
MVVENGVKVTDWIIEHRPLHHLLGHLSGTRADVYVCRGYCSSVARDVGQT